MGAMWVGMRGLMCGGAGVHSAMGAWGRGQGGMGEWGEGRSHWYGTTREPGSCGVDGKTLGFVTSRIRGWNDRAIALGAGPLCSHSPILGTWDVRGGVQGRRGPWKGHPSRVG